MLISRKACECKENYYTANDMQDRTNRNGVLYGILPYSEEMRNHLHPAEEMEKFGNNNGNKKKENFVINDPDSRLIFPEGGAKWIPCWECEQEVYAVNEEGCDGKRNYTDSIPTLDI